MKIKELLKDKSKFLIIESVCLVLLLVFGYLGLGTSVKGTSAAGEYKCDSGYTLVSGTTYCCRDGYSYWGEYKGSYYCYPSKTSIQSYNSAKVRMVTATLNGDYEGDYDALTKACTDQYPGSVRHSSGMALSDGTTIVTCRQELNYFGELVKNATLASDTSTGDSGTDTDVEEACYYNKNNNFYIWTSVTTGDTLYEKAASYDTETNCKYANYKVAQYWLDTKKSSFYKGGGCWIEPGSERFDGTCSLSDAVVAGIVNPTKSGYTFLGWDDSTSCSSPMAVKSTIKIRDNISYYACWKSNGGGVATGEDTGNSGNIGVATGEDTSPTKYTISYNANGGSGAPSSQTKTHGTNLTLSTTRPTRSNYTFKNWNTSKDGSGTSYAAGATYSANASATLYAQWTYTGSSGGNTDTGSSSKTYTVTFNANGGTLNGSSSLECTTSGSSCSIGGLPTATKNGYTFKGWNTSSTCTSGNTGNLTLSADTTYYACFVKQSTSSTGGNNDASDDNNNSNNSNNNNGDNNGPHDNYDNDNNTGAGEISNPQTGEASIIMVFIVGTCAIIYAVWYFKRIKLNKEI